MTGLTWVGLDELPPEASETVELIRAGGPFPYGQDGARFENREQALPDRPSGYYAEYTVETPGLAGPWRAPAGHGLRGRAVLDRGPLRLLRAGRLVTPRRRRVAPMSGLEDVLGRQVPRGTYRWHGAGAEEVRPRRGRRLAVRPPRRFARTTRAALLDALGPALGLLGYHGRNLDALEECVRSLRATVLLWDGWETLAATEPRTLSVVRSILVGDGSTEGTWVLLRGDGPGPPAGPAACDENAGGAGLRARAGWRRPRGR